MPPGVFNVVQGFGPGEVGERLTEHPGVDLITFTGESATGAAIMANAAPTLKRCSFELGGKSAAIVMADADMDRAIAGTIDGMFRNQGEVCLAGSRLFIQRPIYDEFCARYVAAAEALVVGDPRDPGTNIGPLVSVEHLDKVLGYIELGHREGAKLLTGGNRVTTGALADGNYVAPTVFADVDNRYGLAGQIWTTNLDTAHRVAREVRTGTMWVNCFFIRDLRAPFGGMKDSGIGREGGLHSEEFFTEAKAVVIQFPS
jgi:aminomuconate-semialdehyde/2-hydroxymuconate-6-semialdehyde dehydrogenase